MNEPRSIDTRAERYELLMRSLADGIFDWDIARDSLYFSPAWKAQLGYRDDELDNALATWEELLHPEDREPTLVALRLFLDSDALRWDREFRLRHRDGRYRWIRARGSAVRDGRSGSVTRLLGTHSDITALRARRRETEDAREIVDAVFQSMPDVYFLLDTSGLIIDCHSASGAPFFLPAETFPGRRLRDVLPGDAAIGLESAVQEAVLTYALVIHEFVIDLPHDRQYFEARIRSTDDGERAVLAVRDITDQQRSEIDRQQQLRQLTGLSQIYQLAHAAGDARELAQGAVRHLRQSMPDDARVFCRISLDGQHFDAGDSGPQGQRLRGPLFDGEANRGNVAVTVRRGYVLQGDEQRLVNRAAQAISLRLRSDRDREAAETYRRIVAGTQDQVALINRDLTYSVVNPAYAAAQSLPAGEFLGRPVSEILGTAASEQLATQVRKVLDDGEMVQLQEWRQVLDGRRYMNVLYAPYRRDGEIRGVIASCHDISELHEAHAKLRRAAQVFSSSIEAVMMTELDGTIIDVNDAFCEITGFAAREAIDQLPTLLESGRHDKAFFDNMFESLANTGRWRGEIWNRRCNGEVFPCLMTISVVTDERGAPSGYVGVFSDITAIKDNESRLEALANHDPLTGLPNRSQLTRMLERSVEASRRNGDPFTVMYIDFDHFKDVNDSLGHRAGDQLLCTATQRLTGLLRATDMLARVGGDEFVALFPGLHEAGNASLIARKILDAVLRPFEIEAVTVRISASIGIASYPADAQDAETLLRNADTAMYQAKRQGRSDWRWYSLHMTEQATRHLRLLAGLRNAIEQGELSMRYQPQRNLHDNRLQGLEANPHWDHPELGPVPLGEFMSAAEDGGLIRHIDYWALDTVCEQIQRWRSQGLADVRIAVNISARTLQMQHFVEEVAQRLQLHSIPGASLELEITEAALLGELKTDGSRLHALADLGISLAIDNFGSGYSSLSGLSQHPVRRLKIDARFVRQMREDANADSVTRAVLGLGRSLGLQVVALGLDGAELQPRLREYGATLAQGRLCGEAVDADQVALLLNKADRHSDPATDDQPDKRSG